MDQVGDFVIPLQKEDLQKEQGGQYFVQEIYDLTTALKKLNDIKKDVNKKGIEVIFNHFDVIFSVYFDQEITFYHLHDVYDTVIYAFLDALNDYIVRALNLDNTQDKRKALNAIQMVLYLFSLFVKTYEEKLTRNAENMISEPKRGKFSKAKTSKAKKPEENWDWYSRKKAAFTLIMRILNFNLSSLWPTSVADTPFVNMVANCCYKAFENQEIVQAKMKPLRESISHVLALLVVNYNHSSTFVLKAVQLMKHHEHVATALSSTVVIMVKEYKAVTILPKVLLEMNDAVSGGDSVEKPMSAFITDIAETHPSLLMPSVQILRRYLIVEPYSVRIATLVAFTEILIYMQDIPHSEENTIIRDRMLKGLHNHTCDTNSYVRSKALQLWIKLISQKVVPIDDLVAILQTAKERLNDRSCHAVKNAILLFKTALSANPCAGNFNITEIQNSLKKAKQEWKELDSKKKASEEEAWKNIEVPLLIQLTKLQNSPDEENMEQGETLPLNIFKRMIADLLHAKQFKEAYDLLRICEQVYPDSQEIRCNVETDNVVNYYSSVLKKIYLSCLSDVQGKSEGNFEDQLEAKRNVVDYQQISLNFVKLVTEASLEIEKILKGKSSTEVLEAIEFFTVAYQFGVANSRRIVRSALVLVKCKTPGIKEAITATYKTLYLDSTQRDAENQAVRVANRLIKLIKELDQKQKSALGDLIQEWTQNGVLGDVINRVLWEKFTSNDTKPEDRIASLMLLDLMATSNNSLVSSNISILIKYGFSEPSNLLIVDETCKMLAKYGGMKTDNKYIRLYPNHEIFTKAVKCLEDRFLDIPSENYIPLCISVIDMIFKLCCTPEKVTDKLLRSLYEKMINYQQDDEVFDENKNHDDLGRSEEETCSSTLLRKLLVIFGESTFRSFIFTDKDVLNCLKTTKTTEEAPNDDSMDEDDVYRMDTEEAAAEEIIVMTREICEGLVIKNSTLNASLRDIVVKICKNYNDHSCKLVSSAAQAMAKLMMVSHTFCEDSIQIYVSMMTKSKYSEVRQNLVLGFGDLLMRFPNVIEPWSPHLYAMLKDDSTPVRKSSVIVLTHLITREMVKVKGHMAAEFCLCLEDSDPSISEIVQGLIIDISQKGNTLYNVIPDIISMLSNREVPLEPEVFNRTMKFILNLIGKERQNEVLIEKLIGRIRETTNKRHWDDLSFCLAQLNYSEKGLRKLCDAIPNLKEMLMCPNVYESIVSILNHANKAFSKPQIKEIAGEGFKLLDEFTNFKSREKKKSQENMEDEEDDVFDEDAMYKTPKKPIRNTRSRSTRSSTKKPKRK